MNSRRKARELILKALYAHEIGEQAPDMVFDSLVERDKLDEKTRMFARTLYHQILAHVAECDRHIAELARNWKFDRIAAVDKNILRLSITELAHCPDIPAPVSINEAVELAKRYGGKQSPGFVNGILDAFAKTLD